MNDKQRYFNEIALETIKEMTTDVEKWMAFLKTMSYNYIFTYPEQIMIFAQRPNAILCKEFDEWRLEKHRYVKRGSKGIALFANNGYRSYLRYVFDVADTGTRPNSLDLNELWKLEEQHQSYVQKLLENEFKIKENDLLNQIPKVVSKLADEYWHDFEHEFADIVADSFLEEYDGYNKEVAFKRAVTVSATYCVYLRCIEHPENYFENDDFMSIYEFNTHKAINALGTAVNSITTQVLKEVELGIEQYKSEKERRIQDERNELFASGRLSNSQHGIERTEPSRIEQVGANEKDVSRGTQANNLQRHDSERNVDSSLDGSTGNSTEQNGIVDGAVVGKESSTEQENQSDGLGTTYEQPKKRSRRNREDGTNQQLSLLDFISEEEQIQFIDQTENKNQLSSVFSIEQEELNQFLIYGSNTTNSRMMIVTEFMKQKTIEDISQYLRSMYVGGYGIIGDHRNIAAWYGDDGIEFAKGNKAHFVPQAQVIPWLDVAKTIQSLLENGQFATNVELEEAPSFERKQLAEKLWYLYRDFDEPAKEAHLLSKLGEFERKGFPEETQELAKMLQYESYVAILKDQFEEFINLYEQDRSLLRFHYHDCEDIKKRLVELSLPRISFETTISELPPIKSFITDDEIEDELLQGSSFAQGKTRIFNYFAENHTNKEKAEFLKKEYGIGGRSHALSSSDGSGQDHDAKGIRYKKKDCDDVKLSWPQVVKRIDSLMLEERYFPEVMYEFDDEPSNEDMVAKETEVSLEQKVEESKEDDFPYEIGQMVSIDDTVFEITGMNDDIVQLLDKSLSYPVYRVEKKENFEQLVSPMPVNDIEEKKVIEANNFMITDEHLGEGGPKQKYSRNVEAIRLLYQLENEDRNATEEEQEVLSQYVGWGGLPDVFDSQKEAWVKEYKELKELLPKREYEMARASTLNAHYTNPVVIEAMYKALAQMGFTSGNILEPSMGIGNFFGMLPDEMRNSRLYGIELDSISGRIAKKLYPKADITIAGFETTDRRDFYDIAIGNVPFGNYKVSDKPYDKLGFSIHNYFFAKALDQIRPGGVIAFVTSRFTMDQQSPDVRKYITQRAELLGAIRLPNNAFKANAGAEVVSDIIFLQKRDHPIDIEPDWVHLGYSDDIALNSYFVKHPNMILGELTTKSTAYGKDELTVKPYEDKELSALLSEAIINIHGRYQEAEITDAKTMEDTETIPADPDVKNYSYTVVSDEVYFRENSIMRHCNLNETAKGRIKGLVELRQIVNDLIEYQLEDYPNEDIKNKQMELNDVYDSFTDKFGLINSRGNSLAFSDDSSYYLLCSLENIDENGNLESKADMFTKRTIRPSVDITSVDTASEALAISIGERGKIDLPFMSELLGTPNDFDKIINELRGVIFKDPLGSDDIEKDWQTSDEYLSGNVREKLRIARIAAKSNPMFEVNVEALEKAQPKDLDASEIDVRLGATWIDKDYIQQFMYELFETPYYLQSYIEVHYSEMTAEWRITGKSVGSRNDVLVNVTYGTERANGFKILEDTLNLKDVRIYDIIEENGKQKRVLNKRETTLAQQKQQAIKEAFQDWIWKDAKRREHLIQIYNELFNSNRPREYDGSHIRFHGMNPDIELRPHQKNAVAHVLYGGNTLLAHEVGAGKSFEMAASAMESKRLGLCQKSLFVVPNHLTLQWANEFLRLYPSAKLLVASKKDFETANRKKFCARIATGDYDAVIIGHSQFERIPISAQRQEKLLRSQISKEQVMKQAFEIIKISNDGESGEVDTLEGAEFTVKLNSDIQKNGWDNAKVYDVLKTDKKGYAKSIELPYGTYTVKETKIPDNVYPVNDFTVVIDNDSREPQSWKVLNDAPFKALIKAVKLDKETGKTILLPDTTFKIKNLNTGEYVGQWVWFPIPHYMTEFKTDKSGTVTTPNTLGIGEYQIEEIHAPEGYILDKEPIKFTISANTPYQIAEDGKTPIISVTKEDISVKGSISVAKIGEQVTNIYKDSNGNIQFIYEKLPVSGAKFIVEADEDIYSADNQKTLIYAKGEKVAELTTDYGYAETDLLPLGKYRIYEKTAGDGFVINKEVKKVSLTYKDEHTSVVFDDIEYENNRQKVEIEVEKQDKDTGTPLSGAVFGLYAKENIYGIDNRPMRSKRLLVEKGTLIETATSGSDGVAHFNSDLPIGNLFEIKEMKAPIGYASTTQLESVDTSYQGQDKETLKFSYVFMNDITKVEISKKDITNNHEIEGAHLTVYPKDSKGEIFDTWISGQDGKNEDGTIKPHIVKGLEVGRTYVLKETSSPYGYAIADEVEFTVSDTGEIQSVEMKDEMVFGELKWNKTGEIFDQVIIGQTEFGTTYSPIWNKSNTPAT